MMRPISKQICCSLILLSFAALSCQASTLEGRFDGNKLAFTNASSKGASYRPNFWLAAPNILTAKEWLPGYYSLTTSQVTLANARGDAVIADVLFTGLEYNIATAPQQSVPTNSGKPTCTKAVMASGGIFELSNTSPTFCTAATRLVLPGDHIPFRFLRPVIQFDEAKLANQFKGKPSGKYRGTVLGLSASYGFKVSQQNPVWTYRNIPVPFDITIDYQGNKLTNVTVSGNGVLPPTYDTTTHTVSGSTMFDIRAQGYFTDGLKIDLVSKPNYELANTASGEVIPYDVTCKLCNTSTLVRNGKMVASSTDVLKPNANEINFSLEVSYKDIPRGTLVSGSYTDTFVVLMSPKV
ncbi:TPA: hypothetical protein ACGUU3_004222 [Vibrio vulnificus]